MSPNVSESIPASTTVAFGATAALTKLRELLRTGIHSPLRVKRTASTGERTGHLVPGVAVGAPWPADHGDRLAGPQRGDREGRRVGVGPGAIASVVMRPKPPAAREGVES